MKKIIPVDEMTHYILLIRGNKVILDADLACLYGVSTKAFNQAVKRNLQRFPQDFMFQLTEEEKGELVTNCDRFKSLKHSISLPKAFTEHGAVMAASLLNSQSAIEVSIYVVRAFIKMRQLLSQHKEILKKLSSLEQTVAAQDGHIQSIFNAIRQLIAAPPQSKKKIGF